MQEDQNLFADIINALQSEGYWIQRTNIFLGGNMRFKLSSPGGLIRGEPIVFVDREKKLLVMYLQKLFSKRAITSIPLADYATGRAAASAMLDVLAQWPRPVRRSKRSN
ncbi:MAG: hypothetical protein H6817_00790 [Phycisphaerales bacterium]|nr:hypothetical protein [Phycisphaerales bacterium]